MKTMFNISLFVLLILFTSSMRNHHLESVNDGKDGAQLYYGTIEIGADMNGDKKVEGVYLDVISENTNKHLYVLISNGTYEDYLIQFEKVKPRIVLKSDLDIPQLVVNKNPEIYEGISLGNLGDLDDDGCDEIGYVLAYIESPKIDSLRIVSLKNNSWKHRGAVPIYITSAGERYSVTTRDIIVKKNETLYYKTQNDEQIAFTLKD